MNKSSTDLTENRKAFRISDQIVRSIDLTKSAWSEIPVGPELSFRNMRAFNVASVNSGLSWFPWFFSVRRVSTAKEIFYLMTHTVVPSRSTGGQRSLKRGSRVRTGLVDFLDVDNQLVVGDDALFNCAICAS